MAFLGRSILGGSWSAQILKRRRENSQEETLKRIAWAAPVLQLLADDTFQKYPKEHINNGCARL